MNETVKGMKRDIIKYANPASNVVNQLPMAKPIQGTFFN